MDSRLSGPHRRIETPSGDFDGPFQGGDFVGRFNQPHAVDRRFRIDHAEQRPPAPLGSGTSLSHQQGNQPVQSGVGAKGIVHGFNLGQQLGQLLVEILNRKGGIRAVAFHRPVHTGPRADPSFEPGVVGIDEQHIGLVTARSQHRHRIRLIESRHIPEIG